jgi:hypothetical protein
LAVGGLMMRHPARSIQHSMQHSVLCLFQVGLTVLGRPFRKVDRLIRWPEGKGWVVGIRD